MKKRPLAIERHLTVFQVAEYLACRPKKVRTLIHTKEMRPVVRIGREYRVPYSTFLKYLEDSSEEPDIEEDEAEGAEA